MTSKTTINLVVGLLGVALLGCIGGAIGLSAAGNTVPEQLWTIGSTALGALAALLVSTRTDAPAPVSAAAAGTATSGGGGGINIEKVVVDAPRATTLPEPLAPEDHAVA